MTLAQFLLALAPFVTLASAAVGYRHPHVFITWKKSR